MTRIQYWTSFIDQVTDRALVDSPFIEFDPTSTASDRWLSHAKLNFLDDAILDESWRSAQSFVGQAIMNPILSQTGWGRATESTRSSNPKPYCQTFTASAQSLDSKKSDSESQTEQEPQPSLSIPVSFIDLTDLTYQHFWKDHFSSLLGTGLIEIVFSDNPSKEDDIQSSVHLQGLTPVIDYIYLLQCSRPGMLIFGIEHLDSSFGIITHIYTRLLPPSDWLIRHHTSLIPIFGKSYLSKLEDAAADPQRCSASEVSEHSYSELGDPDWEPDSYYDDDDDYGYHCGYDEDDPWRNDVEYYTTLWGTRELRDYTACDSNCGYCGTCDYNDCSC